MATTLSDDPLPGTQPQPANAFDPYLEGPLPSGLRSNCMSCHRFGVYKPSPDQDSGYALAEAGHSAVPAAVASYYQGSLDTSFLWSLADVNLAPSPAAGAHGMGTSLLDRLNQLTTAASAPR
jgi:hypothetical protein